MHVVWKNATDTLVQGLWLCPRVFSPYVMERVGAMTVIPRADLKGPHA